jgi:hypothetical protein
LLNIKLRHILKVDSYPFGKSDAIISTNYDTLLSLDKSGTKKEKFLFKYQFSIK